MVGSSEAELHHHVGVCCLIWKLSLKSCQASSLRLETSPAATAAAQDEFSLKPNWSGLCIWVQMVKVFFKSFHRLWFSLFSSFSVLGWASFEIKYNIKYNHIFIFFTKCFAEIWILTWHIGDSLNLSSRTREVPRTGDLTDALTESKPSARANSEQTHLSRESGSSVLA